MKRLRSIARVLTTMITPVLLSLLMPALAWAQIEEAPGESERSYAMQWGMVTLMFVLSFLILCKPAFREEKLQKEKKLKEKKKGGH